MRSCCWGSLASRVLVLGMALPCFAQAQPAPPTLENLANTPEEQDASAAPKAADSAVNRPAGTVVRPKDGVQHRDLEKTWAEYDAVVAKAAENIRAAIAKQFDAAIAKGDLDAAEKWQAALEKFETSGEVPSGSETKAAVSGAVRDYKKAKEELAKGYEALVKSLTTEKRIAEAKVVREEFRTLGTVVPSPRQPSPPSKPEGPSTRVSEFDFSKPETLTLFRIGGPTAANASGLEFPGTELAWADSTESFTFPLTVTFVASTFPDKNYDCFPGIFSSPTGGYSFKTKGIHLHWGNHANTRTVLLVFGRQIEIKHRPIAATRPQTITMSVNRDRKLLVVLNGEKIYEEVLDPGLRLDGSVRCSGGFGHVLFHKVTVESEVK
jgi:hypothetical protein